MSSSATSAGGNLLSPSTYSGVGGGGGSMDFNLPILDMGVDEDDDNDGDGDGDGSVGDGDGDGCSGLGGGGGKNLSFPLVGVFVSFGFDGSVMVGGRVFVLVGGGNNFAVFSVIFQCPGLCIMVSAPMHHHCHAVIIHVIFGKLQFLKFGQHFVQCFFLAFFHQSNFGRQRFCLLCLDHCLVGKVVNRFSCHVVDPLFLFLVCFVEHRV